MELRVWSGCPSHERAHQMLVTALSELGHAGRRVAVRWVESERDAAALGFVGSPTFVVDGRDVLPPPADVAPSLTCRVYVRANGRFSPVPDAEHLRDALAAHLRPASSARASVPAPAAG